MNAINLNKETKVITLQGQDFYEDKQKRNGYSFAVSGRSLRHTLRINKLKAVTHSIKREDMSIACKNQAKAQSIADRIKSGQLKSLGKHEEPSLEQHLEARYEMAAFTISTTPAKPTIKDYLRNRRYNFTNFSSFTFENVTYNVVYIGVGFIIFKKAGKGAYKEIKITY